MPDGVTEALEDGRTVPKPEWEAAIKEVLLEAEFS